MATIAVGTSSGLRTFAPDGSELSLDLDGGDVRALAPENWSKLWAIVDRRQIWHRDGAGWEQVATLDDLSGAETLDAVCLADTRANSSGGILIGTSRARLLRVTGEGKLEFVAAFDNAPGRDRWFTPWGGPPDTRTISEDRESVFVNVHVGGVLRSTDEGASWEPTIDIGADVHQVATGDGIVYAAGAHGLSLSLDAGQTWELRAEGLHARYCRAVAVCGSRLLLSASEGPGGGRAALYRSDLTGGRFERCREGLPEWFSGNLDSGCVDALPDGTVAAFGSGEGNLYASSNEGAGWTRIATGLGRVRCVRVLP